ncbi:MAG: bifunctional metallophosphatase/5'-nucleotidase [Clostridia bacterium]|nr:bifunctional metallophosphatase/5'-nucleotidase [Clostridia bacterium]
MKKLLLFILAISFVLLSFSFSVTAVNATDNNLAIVFSHDLHSFVEPFVLNGKSVGGFARIKTVIDNVKADYSNTIVVDGGDFSMGTLYQSAFITSAIEYRLLSYLGYDALTFGNHEFDYGFDNLKQMLTSAKKFEEALPPILCSNINTEKTGISKSDLEALNIHEYTIIDSNDYKIAVFGLLGRDAVELITDEAIVFDDYIETAKNVVTEIKNLYSPDVIICLSHSGTGSSVGDEDIKLARAIDDIDVIISGHTHSYLPTPIIENGTIIASVGEYGANMGKIILNPIDKNNRLVSYELIEINDSIKSDENTTQKIEEFKTYITDYLSMFGYNSPNQIVAYSPFDFPEQGTMSGNLCEQPLGNLISDAYIHAVKSAEGDKYAKVDVAAAPVGLIRASIDKGYITVSQVYEISSLGIGNDNISGYPLCSVYLYGSELWSLAEIDASVSGVMPYAQLYFSGLGYKANTNRMFLNRVYDCWLIGENGERIEIEKDKLYRVVSGITSAEMLGTVKDKSFGLLSLTPKDIDGNAITDFTKCIIKTDKNVELKEWKALADYLSAFPADSNGVSVIPSLYASTEGRKNISSYFSIPLLFTKWNFITWAVFCIVNLLLVLIILIIILIIKKIRKKRRLDIAVIIAKEDSECESLDCETDIQTDDADTDLDNDKTVE